MGPCNTLSWWHVTIAVGRQQAAGGARRPGSPEVVVGARHCLETPAFAAPAPLQPALAETPGLLHCLSNPSEPPSPPEPPPCSKNTPHEILSSRSACLASQHAGLKTE